MKKHSSFITAFLLLTINLVIRWDAGLAGEHQPSALVKIEIIGETQLEQFAALNIPIYAQLWDAQGNMVLLAGPDRGEQVLIERMEFATHLLDSDPQGGDYYLLLNPEPDLPYQLPENVRVLEEIRDQLLVRVLPQDAEALVTTGFEIRRLWLEPLVLPSVDTRLRDLSAVTPHMDIQAMIDQASSGTAYNYVGDLSGEWQITVNDNPYTLSTRYSYASDPIKKATRFVYEHFTGLGLTTYYDHFYISEVQLRSVIAEQPGVTNPGCIVLLVGHLDSTSLSPYSEAPGADDNASGSAGVLIAADILHQYQFECTIRYILFTGEEQGLWGSKAYAEDVYAAGENIVAVVDLDMLGYNSDQYEVIELHTRKANTGDLAIANLFKGVIQAYGINLTTQILDDGLSFSDHSPFWSKGYHAILCIEDWYGDRTPDYHQVSDRLNTLDLSYYTDYIRAAVGTVAHLAGYIPPSPEPLFELFFPLVFKSD